MLRTLTEPLMTKVVAVVWWVSAFAFERDENGAVDNNVVVQELARIPMQAESGREISLEAGLSDCEVVCQVVLTCGRNQSQCHPDEVETTAEVGSGAASEVQEVRRTKNETVYEASVTGYVAFAWRSFEWGMQRSTPRR